MESIATLTEGSASAQPGQCARGEIAREEPAARPPNICALRHVGDEDGDLRHVSHFAVSCLDQIPNLGLLILIIRNDFAVVAAGNHAEDVREPIHDEAVRPATRRWFSSLWTEDARNARVCVCWLSGSGLGESRVHDGNENNAHPMNDWSSQIALGLPDSGHSRLAATGRDESVVGRRVASAPGL